jgi:hypothetical protein
MNQPTPYSLSAAGLLLLSQTQPLNLAINLSRLILLARHAQELCAALGREQLDGVAPPLGPVRDVLELECVEAFLRESVVSVWGRRQEAGGRR